LAIGEIVKLLTTAVKSGAVEKGTELLKVGESLKSSGAMDKETLAQLFQTAQKTGASGFGGSSQGGKNENQEGDYNTWLTKSQASPGMENVTKMYTPIRTLKRH
jgi:hypothetical protein